jgi:hypothetical protein
MFGIHDPETFDMGQIERGHTLLCLQQHRFGNIDATNPIGTGIVRQRYAGTDADLKNAASDPLGGLYRCLATPLKHRAEHQIIDRCPSRVGPCDSLFVEIRVHQLAHSSLLPALRHLLPCQAGDSVLLAHLPRVAGDQ